MSICGEMAGDPRMTRLFLGMGLRQFSMHPAQLLEIKQQILRSDSAVLQAPVSRMLRLDDSDRIDELLVKLNA